MSLLLAFFCVQVYVYMAVFCYAVRAINNNNNNKRQFCAMSALKRYSVLPFSAYAEVRRRFVNYNGASQTTPFKRVGTLPVPDPVPP